MPHNSFPYQNSQWKVQVRLNVVTPQELKMVCRESNEINFKKIVLRSIAEKKKCLLLVRYEKNCRPTSKLGVEKSLTTKTNHNPPPMYQMVHP